MRYRSAGAAFAAGLFLTISADATAADGVALPKRPNLTLAEYPACAQEYTKMSMFEARVQSIQDCIVELEAFNSITLPSFVSQMRRYVQKLQAISAIVIKNRKLAWDKRDAIVKGIREETGLSDPNGGDHFKVYRILVAKYRGQMKSLLAVRSRLRYPSN